MGGMTTYSAADGCAVCHGAGVANLYHVQFVAGVVAGVRRVPVRCRLIR